MRKLFKVRSVIWAGLLLALMFGLGIFSMRGDSGIVDEVAHIPAGYSYLKFGDYRLNPEHPPLIKDLAALPLLFLHLKFPSNIAAWTTEPNGQWETGWNFIYHIGNNADQILFWSRLPVLVLAIVFGFVLFWFVRQRFGAAVALLTLFFYALSPNIIAHSRLVTTDLGVAAFTFFAFMAFFAFIDKPSAKTITWASIFMALAQLSKFSAFTLYPLFGLLTVVAIVAKSDFGTLRERLKTYLGGIIIIFIASFALVWAFYIPHTWHMPADVQDKLITASLPGGYQKAIGERLVQINSLPLMKPLAQYLLGLLMVFNRVSSGNTTYFMGQVTNQSFLSYFPVTFGIKTQVAFLIMMVGAIVAALTAYLKKTPWQWWRKFLVYARTHFVELSSVAFIVMYSYISITGNLDLGIRHLMPMLPFIFMLVAKWVAKLFENHKLPLRRPAVLVTSVLLVWYGAAAIWIYPHYLAYFNELIGGPSNSYKYLSDSSVDWGQDLKRLAGYVKDHPEIQNIAVDYFGGGDPRYYFCKRLYNPDGSLVATASGYDCSSSPYVEWHAQYGRFWGDYMAVSETFLMNDLYWAPRRGDEGYGFLRDMQPVAKIGYSIYVYKIR